MPADLAALVAVASAYAAVSPPTMMFALSTIEAHMAQVEVSYQKQRMGLHAAVGGALFALHGED